MSASRNHSGLSLFITKIVFRTLTVGGWELGVGVGRLGGVGEKDRGGIIPKPKFLSQVNNTREKTKNSSSISSATVKTKTKKCFGPPVIAASTVFKFF